MTGSIHKVSSLLVDSSEDTSDASNTASMNQATANKDTLPAGPVQESFHVRPMNYPAASGRCIKKLCKKHAPRGRE